MRRRPPQYDPQRGTCRFRPPRRRSGCRGPILERVAGGVPCGMAPVARSALGRTIRARWTTSRATPKGPARRPMPAARRPFRLDVAPPGGRAGPQEQRLEARRRFPRLPGLLGEQREAPPAVTDGFSQRRIEGVAPRPRRFRGQGSPYSARTPCGPEPYRGGRRESSPGEFCRGSAYETRTAGPRPACPRRSTPTRTFMVWRKLSQDGRLPPPQSFRRPRPGRLAPLDEEPRRGQARGARLALTAARSPLGPRRRPNAELGQLTAGARQPKLPLRPTTAPRGLRCPSAPPCGLPGPTPRDSPGLEGRLTAPAHRIPGRRGQCHTARPAGPVRSAGDDVARRRRLLFPSACGVYPAPPVLGSCRPPVCNLPAKYPFGSARRGRTRSPGPRGAPVPAHLIGMATRPAGGLAGAATWSAAAGRLPVRAGNRGAWRALPGLTAPTANLRPWETPVQNVK